MSIERVLYYINSSPAGEEAPFEVGKAGDVALQSTCSSDLTVGSLSPYNEVGAAAAAAAVPIA